MSGNEVRRWLAARTPTPPAALSSRLREMVGGDVSEPVADGLLDRGTAVLRGLLAGDCVHRGSAIDLLAADALVTYAFEAAADDPATLDARAREAMTRIAAIGTEEA